MAVQMLGTRSAAAATVYSGATTAQRCACGGGAFCRSRRAGTVGGARAHQILQAEACRFGRHGLQAVERTADNATATTAARNAARTEGSGRAGDNTQAATSSTTAAGSGAVHA